MQGTLISHGYLVDHNCTVMSLTSIEFVLGGDGEPYQCTLNQTDLKTNKNKFYIMQLLEYGVNEYVHFIRYGRIGEVGVIQEKQFSGKDLAVKSFITQFKTKTGNDWKDRDQFVLKSGKYYLTNTDRVAAPETAIVKNLPIPDSKLDTRVQQLLRLFTDREMLTQSLVSMDIDINKMPLGKIDHNQITLAKNTLLAIQKKLDDLKNADADDGGYADVADAANGELKEIANEVLQQLSSQYYTYIPYPCRRGSKLPMIDTTTKVGQCLENLDDLENISINVELTHPHLQESHENIINPIDRVYNTIGTNIAPLDRNSERWSQIAKYLEVTHTKTHHFKLKLHDIFEIERPDARKRYRNSYRSLGNLELLIHGSRMCNWASILKHGLLLDPSKLGVYITGKMFGNGIYFANSFSKSAQYCGLSGSKGLVCFTLAEVALGTQLQKTDADYYLSKQSLAEKKCDSTWGKGQSTPESMITVEDDLKIPNTPLTTLAKDSSSVLLYDEKIVYDQDQFDLRYLVIAEMSY